MRGASTRAVRWGGWCGSLLGLALILGCGGSETPAGEAPLPAHVRITLVDAKVGPGEIDDSGTNGRQWDSNIPLPVETIQTLTRSLSIIDKRAAIAAQGITALGWALEGFGPPDPVGHADLVIHGQIASGMRLALKGQEDTFTPAWVGPPSWHRVPFDSDLRIVGEVRDSDPLSTEHIGTFQLSYDVLVAALRSNKVYQVQVADQTHNQLLFLGIQVWAVP